MATMSNNVITPKLLPPLNTQITSNMPVNTSTLARSHRPPPLTLLPQSHSDLQYTAPCNEEIEAAIILNIDEVVKHRMCGYAKMNIIATKSAIEMHNQWRNVYIQQNGNVPCIKKNKEGKEVDINVDGDVLCSEFLEFNYNISIFVATCIKFYPYKHIEEISSIIHRKWLMMNPSANESAFNIPYTLLPEIEKNKKRNIFRIVSDFM